MAYADYLTLGKEVFAAKTAHTLPPAQSDCPELEDGIRCRAGKCSFWVTWQGRLTPCGMFPETESNNVFAEVFETVWNRIKNQVAAIRLPGACDGCSAKFACRACGAMVLAESGDFAKVPQYRCRMTQAYPAQWQRVKEEIL